MSDALTRRRDPGQNVAGLYAVNLQADLLTRWSVVREWGHIGRAGQVKIETHAALEIAETAARKIEASKRCRGYS